MHKLTRWFAFSLGWLGLTLAAQSANPLVTQELRFLFVVDTSSSMSRYADSARNALFQLVNSGLQGQMKVGDRYTLWTFNNQVYTNLFAPTTWDPLLNQALANQAVKFLKAQHFGKTSQLNKVWEELHKVARTSNRLTIIFIMDGYDLIHGTPFDQALNNIYLKYRQELRGSRTPFLTTLVAQQGQYVAYTVNAAGLPIAFDELAKYIPPITPSPPINPPPPSTTNLTEVLPPPRADAHEMPMIAKVVVPPVLPSDLTNLARPPTTLTSPSNPGATDFIDNAAAPRPGLTNAVDSLQTNAIAQPTVSSTGISTNIPAPTNQTNFVSAAKPVPPLVQRTNMASQTATPPSAGPSETHASPPSKPPLGAGQQIPETPGVRAQTNASLVKSNLVQSFVKPSERATAQSPSPAKTAPPAPRSPKITPQTGVAIAPQTWADRSRYLIAAGAAILVFSGLLIFVLYRMRTRKQPSLISRSIERALR